MPHVVVDAMDNVGLWSALAADGVTPSTELALHQEDVRIRYGADGHSGRLTATTGAAGHRLQRGLPNLDLTQFEEIRLWLFSSRRADGSASEPFFLEVRLASAAMDFVHPGNDWRRLLPVSAATSWELVRLGLDDLPPPVRTAVDRIQVRCLDASQAFECYLDDVLAVRDEMIADVDAALLSRLDGQISVAGSPLAAEVVVSADGAPSVIPSIRIVNYDLRFADLRGPSTRNRGDYRGNSYRLRPQHYAYDLFYAVEAVANDRADQARILEFVLRTLPPRSELLVNGIPLQVRAITLPAGDMIGGGQTERLLLHYQVSARQEVGPPVPVVPAESVMIQTDQGAPT